MKVNKITDNIYLRGRSDHLSYYDKYSTVNELHITNVVNLWSHIDRGLQDIVPVYLHLPMADGSSVPAGLRETAVTLAAAIRDADAHVLIQCHAGRNRSGLLAAAILWALTGKPGSDCLEFVRTQRPGAVDNDDFETWLDMLPGFDLKEG